jgi:DNA-binding NarL/FixJ family response regulator
MITVILADDHAIVRRGIRDFMAEMGDIQVLAEAETGAEALAAIREHQPAVAVLDVQMPNGGGIDVTRTLRAEGYTLGILILTAYDDPPYIRAALEAGANGYVLKSSDAEEIVEAVRAVYEGKQVMDAKLISTGSTAALSPSALLARLTDREREVLALAAQGLTNKAIGFRLAISDRTVQGHLANIYEKLGVSSRTEAVTRAVSAGLLGGS